MLRLDINLVFTIVNLLVLYFLLKKFLVKPVMEIMNKRQALIDQTMAGARETEGEAARLKARYEEMLQSSKEEGAAIVTEARDSAKVQYDRIVNDAQSQADRIIKTAHETADADQEKAMRQAHAQIAGLVMAAAAKVVSGEAGESSNQALYEKYLAEAGEAHDAGSM